MPLQKKNKMKMKIHKKRDLIRYFNDELQVGLVIFLFSMFLLLTIVFSTTRQRKLAFLWDLSLGSCFTLELAHHRHLRFLKIFMKYFLPGYIPSGIFLNQVGSRECGWQDLPVWLHPFRSPANWTQCPRTDLGKRF